MIFGSHCASLFLPDEIESVFGGHYGGWQVLDREDPLVRVETPRSELKNPHDAPMNSPDTSSTDPVQARTLSSLFDEVWYLARYSEAAASELEPLLYYLEVGDAAGHFPHPLFDSDFYSEQHPDLAREGGARLLHYVDVGEKSGSWANRLFDPIFYREQTISIDRSEWRVQSNSCQ